MMFEESFLNIISPLVVGRVWYDTMPPGYVIAVNAPVIVLQQVGGKARWYVEKDSPMPDHKHARMMVTVWGRSRLEVAPLARLVELAIAQSSFVAEPSGAAAESERR